MMFLALNNFSAKTNYHFEKIPTLFFSREGRRAPHGQQKKKCEHLHRIWDFAQIVIKSLNKNKHFLKQRSSKIAEGGWAPHLPPMVASHYREGAATICCRGGVGTTPPTDGRQPL